MADTAADVPGKFDIIIDGHGYVFANAEVQRAKYGLSPTFVERQNVSGNYGDNQQDFWLTASQNDWSLGEQQRFLRLGDGASKRRYWSASKIDISREGQATIQSKEKTLTFSETIRGMETGYGIAYAFGDTNLFSIGTTGTITSLGAHGAGTGLAIASDRGGNLFIAGATSIRRYSIGGATFNAFNATTSPVSLAMAGNILYGIDSNTLYSYSTAGVATSAFQWKGGSGAAANAPGLGPRMVSYAGTVYILRPSDTNPEIYTGDTTGVTQLASLPTTFQPDSLHVSHGIVFAAGYNKNPTRGTRIEVWYYQNGTLDILYAGQYATGITIGHIGMGDYQDGLVFNDPIQGAIMYYNLATGSVSSIAAYTAASSQVEVYWGTSYVAPLYAQAASTVGSFFYDTTAADTGTISSSLIDFESSLDKYVKAIKVDWIPATDGDGGSVDVAYQLNSLDGAYTNIQTGAVAGTEYTIGQSCRSISIKVTLNRGTSTLGPILKRVYLRSAPVQQTFKTAEVVIDCGGANGKTPVIMRNGNPHPLDGQAQATNLRTSAMTATPVSITDRFGTFTGIIEGGDGFDLIEVRPEEYIARARIRQV